jgi:hypothetical protein
MTPPSVTTWGISLAVAVAATIAVSGPIGAETVSPAEAVERLPAVEIVRAAKALLVSGDALAAREVATAYLSKYPGDSEMLVVLSLAEAALGNGQGSFKAGRAAFDMAATPEGRYTAARAAARGAYVAGEYGRSQYWLRRAAISAPTEADTARTARDFRLARSKRALLSRLNFGFSTSDNVNGGASGSLLTVDGLPFVGELSPDAQALSGTYGWGSVNGSLRLAETPRSRTELTFGGYGRLVWLSKKSQEAAPSVENGDYAVTALSFGAAHKRLIGEAGLELGGSVEFGQQTFGGEVTSRHLTLGTTLQRRVSARGAITLGAEVERRALGSDGDRSETEWQLSFGYSNVLAGGGRVRLQSRWSSTSSDVSNNVGTSFEARAGYDFGKPVGPVRLSVDIGAGWADYPDYALFVPVPGGRQDKRLFGAIEIVPDKVQWAGFAPVLTITGSRTSSNVSRFDSDELAFTLGVRSTF